MTRTVVTMQGPVPQEEVFVTLEWLIAAGEKYLDNARGHKEGDVTFTIPLPEYAAFLEKAVV